MTETKQEHVHVEAVRGAVALIGFLLIPVGWIPMPPPVWVVYAGSYMALGVIWAIGGFLVPTPWRISTGVGVLLNTIALLANGGRMPVAQFTEKAVEISRWWQPVTEHTRLLSLCDVIYGFSIGDLLILGAIPLYFVCRAFRPRPALENSQAYQNELLHER